MISALHRTTQKGLPITVAAAGLPQIPKLSGEARSYAERLFDLPTIENLDRDGATAALVGPARSFGVEYTDEAVEAALEWTAGYSFYIQQLGKHAWNLAEGPQITIDDVNAAKPVAEDTLDRSIYFVRIQRATVAEQRYMRAMAVPAVVKSSEAQVWRNVWKVTVGRILTLSMQQIPEDN